MQETSLLVLCGSLQELYQRDSSAIIIQNLESTSEKPIHLTQIVSMYILYIDMYV